MQSSFSLTGNILSESLNVIILSSNFRDIRIKLFLSSIIDLIWSGLNVLHKYLYKNIPSKPPKLWINTVCLLHDKLLLIYEINSNHSLSTCKLISIVFLIYFI